MVVCSTINNKKYSNWMYIENSKCPCYESNVITFVTFDPIFNNSFECWPCFSSAAAEQRLGLLSWCHDICLFPQVIAWWLIFTVNFSWHSPHCLQLPPYVMQQRLNPVQGCNRWLSLIVKFTVEPVHTVKERWLCNSLFNEASRVITRRLPLNPEAIYQSY